MLLIDLPDDLLLLTCDLVPLHDNFALRQTNREWNEIVDYRQLVLRYHKLNIRYNKTISYDNIKLYKQFINQKLKDAFLNKLVNQVKEERAARELQQIVNLQSQSREVTIETQTVRTRRINFPAILAIHFLKNYIRKVLGAAILGILLFIIITLTIHNQYMGDYQVPLH